MTEPSLEPKKLSHQAAQALRTALGLIVAVRSGRAFQKPNTLVKLVLVLLNKEAVDYDKELAQPEGKTITQTALKGLVNSYQRVIVNPASRRSHELDYHAGETWAGKLQELGPLCTRIFTAWLSCSTFS